MSRKIIYIVAILLVLGCVSTIREERVELTTTDGIKLIGTYYDAKSEKGILLLHMLERDRNTYSQLAKKLENYKVLAIDLRGHGESQGNWKEFTSTDFNDMLNDVKAGMEFLKKRGANTLYIIGASIGANIGLKYAALEPVKKIVLLSPGLDYRGIKTEEAAKAYKGKTLIIVSSEDSYAVTSSKKLKEYLEQVEVKVFHNIGHGTEMLKPNVIEIITTWLSG